MSIVTSAAGDPGQMTRPTGRVALRRIDTLIRQPPVVLGLAAAVAGAVFVLATPRVLPLLGGLGMTLLI